MLFEYFTSLDWDFRKLFNLTIFIEFYAWEGTEVFLDLALEFSGVRCWLEI